MCDPQTSESNLARITSRMSCCLFHFELKIIWLHFPALLLCLQSICTGILLETNENTKYRRCLGGVCLQFTRIALLLSKTLASATACSGTDRNIRCHHLAHVTKLNLPQVFSFLHCYLFDRSTDSWSARMREEDGTNTLGSNYAWPHCLLTKSNTMMLKANLVR